MNNISMSFEHLLKTPSEPKSPNVNSLSNESIENS